MYGQTSRSIDLARAAVGVAKTFNVAFMGLAGTCHQKACEELGVRFIAGQLPAHVSYLRIYFYIGSLQNGSRIWITVPKENF